MKTSIDGDIPKNPFQISRLEERLLEQSIEVVFSALSHANQLWNLSQEQKKDSLAEIRKRIIPGLYSGHSYVLSYEDKVIGVSVQLDWMDYSQIKKIPLKQSLFSQNDLYSSVLEVVLKSYRFTRGQAIISVFGVIDPNYTNLGYAFKFWWHQFALGKKIGYKYFFAITSNQMVLRVLYKMGARCLCTAQMSQHQNRQMVMVMVQVSQLPPFQSIFQSLRYEFSTKL